MPSVRNSLFIATGVLAVVAILGWGMRYFGDIPAVDPCEKEQLYSASWTSDRTVSGEVSLPLGNHQKIEAKVRLIPVAAKTLYRVTVENPIFTGYPQPVVAQLTKTFGARNLFLQTTQTTAPVLWISGSSTSSDNVAKLLIAPMNVWIPKSSGRSTVQETDTIGSLSVEYERKGTALTRKRLNYSTSRSGPLPLIQQSEETYTLDFLSRVVQASTVNVLHYAMGSAGSGTITSTEKNTWTREREEPSSLVAECRATEVEQYVKAKGLSTTNFAMIFEPPTASSATKAFSIAELLAQLSKAKDPMKVLADITEAIERDPRKTRDLQRALERATANEDRTAHLLSALAHAKMDQAQQALRDLMELYRKMGKERLLIHAIRSQQFGGFITRENVENLYAYSRDRSIPARPRQAALLAAGTTATQLGERGVIQRFREQWESDFANSPGQLAKIEALSAIGNMGAPESLALLKSVAQENRDLVGDQAVEAMRLIPDEAAKEALLKEARDAKEKQRRRVALEALTFTPSSEKMCNALISQFNALLTQFGTSRAPERIQILGILSQNENLRHPTVQKFFKETLPNESRLTQKERDLRDQALTLF